MSNTQTYHLTLLRHGESTGNAEKKHQGQVDFPLTERGVQQVRTLAARWNSERVTFDLAISSPLARARQTAEILVAELNIPLEFDPLWMERDAGLISGLDHQIATEQYPSPDFIHLYQPIAVTGESLWDLYSRACQAVGSLLRHPPGHYLVVSHGAIMNMVLYAMLGISPQANFQGPYFRFDNAAFASLTYEPERHIWRVLGINDIAHWPSDETSPSK